MMYFYGCTDGSGNRVFAYHDYRMAGREDVLCKFSNLRQKEVYAGQTWTPDSSLGRDEIIEFPNALQYPDAPLGKYPDVTPASEWPEIQAMPSDGGALLVMAADILVSGGIGLPEYQWPDGAYLEPLAVVWDLTGSPVREAISEYDLFDGCSSPTLALKWIPQLIPNPSLANFAGVTLRLNYGQELTAIYPDAQPDSIDAGNVSVRIVNGEDTPDGYSPTMTYGVDSAVFSSADGKVYVSTQIQCGNPPPGTGWIEETTNNTVPPFENSVAQFFKLARLVLRYQEANGNSCQTYSRQFKFLEATQPYLGDDPPDSTWYLTFVGREIKVGQVGNEYCRATCEGADGDDVEIRVYHNEYPLVICGWHGSFTITWDRGDLPSPANALRISLT